MAKAKNPPAEIAEESPVLTKTGECYSRDENGDLWVCESFVDQNGQVSTQSMRIEE